MARILTLLFLAASAHAEPSVVVLPFKGPGASDARRAVAALLGVSPHADGKLAADFRLEGTVESGAHAIDLHVVDGRSGDLLETLKLRAKGAHFKRFDPASVARLRAALQPTPPVAMAEAEARPEPPPDVPRAVAPEPLLPPPTPEPAPIRAEETLVSAQPAETHQPSALPALDLAVGGGVMSRSLSYTDDLFHALDSYRLSAGASLEAAADFYPGALAVSGWPARIGLTGRYNLEPALASYDTAGDRLTTTSDAWELGPKVRVPFGIAELSASATWARQRFSVQIPPGAGLVVPGVAYSALRGDVGARITVFERVTLLADAAYLHVLGSGEVASQTYFPRLGVAAVEGRLGAAVRISGPFEARTWADYRRYFFSMNPRPGDPYIAGGALDEYVTLTGALAVRW
jgi:hypothetical protein